MRKLTLLFAPAALALIASPIFAQVPPGTTTLTFDNYCDGVTITVTGDMISGSHDNYDCNGDATFVAGVVAKDLLLAPKALPTSRANIATNYGLLQGVPVNIYLDFTNNKWAAYYEADGSSPETLLNRGTFTIANLQANKIGGVGSLQVHANGSVPEETDPNIAPDAGNPKGTYTIQWFDASGVEFCDFMVLTAKWSKIGGTHDMSNCPAGNAYVAGNNSTLPMDASGAAGKGGILQSNVEL